MGATPECGWFNQTMLYEHAMKLSPPASAGTLPTARVRRKKKVPSPAASSLSSAYTVSPTACGSVQTSSCAG